jgi:hypothetical protein
MGRANQVTKMRTIVLAVAFASGHVLAEPQAPAPVTVNEEDVLRMFTQRERERTEQQWLRNLAPAPVPAPYDWRSLQNQMWYSQWRLRQQKRPLPAGGEVHCRPPDFIPPPPFRLCPNLPFR